MRISKCIGVVFVLFTFFSGSALLGEVKIAEKGSVWYVATSKYSVVIGKNGYLSSLKVGNAEFLTQLKKVPCGTYLCAGGIPPLKTVKKTGADSLSGENNIARITYKFDENDFLILVDKIKKKGCYYILINRAVKTVYFACGKESVPTVAATPAKAACDHTRWFSGEASLDVERSDGIWLFTFET